jgi:hypothetical protein
MLFDNCFRKGLGVCSGDIFATLAPITGTAEDLQIGHGIPAALAPWDDVIEMRFYGRTAHAQIPVARDTRHALALSPVPRRHRDLYGLRDGLPPARFLDGPRDGLPLATFLDGLPPASFLGGLQDGLPLASFLDGSPPGAPQLFKGWVVVFAAHAAGHMRVVLIPVLA